MLPTTKSASGAAYPLPEKWVCQVTAYLARDNPKPTMQGYNITGPLLTKAAHPEERPWTCVVYTSSRFRGPIARSAGARSLGGALSASEIARPNIASAGEERTPDWRFAF